MGNSVQELVEKSRIALAGMEDFTQEQADEMCIAIGKAVQANAEILAKEAIEETQMGIYSNKVGKNAGTGANIWRSMKGKKSVGIVGEDKEKGIIYVAHPKGVIASISPVTNPTITPLGNAMLAVKGRNTMIVSPHPRSERTTTHTVEIMSNALRKLGAPENVLQVLDSPTFPKTQELMALSDTVVATGGTGLVEAAYASGTPAYGVGQGNVQHIIADDYEDIGASIERIVAGRIVDNGVICAGDQSIIYPEEKHDEVVRAIKASNSFYVDDPATLQKFRDVLFTDGHFTPGMAGQPVSDIAEAVGLDVPEGTRAIVLKVDKYGAEELICGEKMCPVIVALSYKTFKEGVAIAKANLLYQGAGHSSAVDTNKREYVEYVGAQLPVSRLLVNQSGLSAGGQTNNLYPTTSLGCGSWGGNSISENLNYKHLLNISRIAYPRTEPHPTAEQVWTEPAVYTEEIWRD
jgi:succinate-semialdehyde dehydrogenase